MKGDGVMTDLAAHARLRPGQISLLIDLMEEANPSWSPDVAYQLIASQDCTPERLERLIGWCDDPGTWDIAIVLRDSPPSFRTVGNHAGLFWFSIYRFNVFNGAPPAVPA